MSVNMLNQARRRRTAWAMAGMISGSLAGGCGAALEDCDETVTCGPPAPPPCDSDPASGHLEERCGIFVSPQQGRDYWSGTKEQPVATFAKAIELAQQSGTMRIYAANESAAEAVVVPQGIEIWGGIVHPGGNIWFLSSLDDRTTLAPPVDQIPLRVAAGNGEVSTLSGLRIKASAAMLAAGSSVAMVVESKAAVKLLRCDLFAGNGGAPGGSSFAMRVEADAVVDLMDCSLHAQNGAEGELGEDAGIEPAHAGFAGVSGTSACLKDIAPGGTPVVTSCGDSDSISGSGGEGALDIGGNGYDGRDAPSPNDMGYGKGGAGQVSGLGCMEGRDGATGADGANGSAAKGYGLFEPTRWVGSKGGDGGLGLPGQGGGGGGGARGGAMFCGRGPQGGASGGSGGSGGCGGSGGKGGGPGGSSIGIYVYKGKLTLSGTSIETGIGGHGGTGGKAQFGGFGGSGGDGGESPPGAQPGCDGGRGGKGGNGGYGGGGLGGHSIGIVSVDVLPVGTGKVEITLGMPGKGGDGGNGNAADAKGDDGIRQKILYP